MGQNFCKVGVVSAAFALMYLCFMDHRRVCGVFAMTGLQRTRLLILCAALALVYA